MIAVVVHHTVVVHNHFWPTTAGSWAAIIAALAGAMAVLLGARNRKTIQEIHVLSNGRLQRVEAQRDKLVDEKLKENDDASR